MSEEFNDEVFHYNYLSNKFKETSKEPFNVAILKRRCMILSLAHASKSLDNATSCNIFEDQLQEYFTLVDDRNGINNFAKATLDLMSNVKNVSKSWKSDLPSTPEIPNSLNTCSSECVNSTDDGFCGNGLPPSSFVHQLLGAFQISKLNKPTTSTVQTTLDGFRKASTSLDITQIKENKRKTLYSSYDKAISESKESHLYEDNLQKNNFVDLRSNKNSLYSSYSETKNSVIKQEKDISEYHSKQGNQFERKKKKISSSLHSNYSEVSTDEPSSKGGAYYQVHGGKGYSRACKPIFTCGALNNTSSDNEEDSTNMGIEKHFKTASRELQVSNQKKFGNQKGGRSDYERDSGRFERNSGFQPSVAVKKFLGGKRSVASKFVPPVKNNSQEEDFRLKENFNPETELDERLKNIEPRMVELIQNEIMDSGSKVDWDDIAGLNFAKTTIQEIVVWPMLRPDIFTGLRRPPKGILLFGPPGTGKTLIGKCVASQSNSTFFSISASSLTSKWIGDGEKMVRALFAVARCHQPAVVFIDEIDSLLSQRSDTEHESSRRIKTEFLVQLDGAATGEEDRILIIGATNRPQELDEAARRRLVKRLYIPLPDKEARKQLTENLMKLERNDLTPDDIEEISCITDGYSGADMKNLCQEASLGPIRSISSKDMFQISAEQVRPVNISDFKIALKRVKSSVSSQDLEIYLKWDDQYGSGSFTS